MSTFLLSEKKKNKEWLLLPVWVFRCFFILQFPNIGSVIHQVIVASTVYLIMRGHRTETLRVNVEKK